MRLPGTREDSAARVEGRRFRLILGDSIFRTFRLAKVDGAVSRSRVAALAGASEIFLVGCSTEGSTLHAGHSLERILSIR